MLTLEYNVILCVFLYKNGNRRFIWAHCYNMINIIIVFSLFAFIVRYLLTIYFLQESPASISEDDDYIQPRRVRGRGRGRGQRGRRVFRGRQFDEDEEDRLVRLHRDRQERADVSLALLRQIYCYTT